MISFLRGVVAEKTETQVVLDVAGVGYGLVVSHDTHSDLVLGKEAQLIVYEHIKEESHDLYGFMDRPSKKLFEKLLSVNGVGPKMAIIILNLGNSNQLISAIASGETKYIQTASGVGKRLAERIVVDLKDKMDAPSSADAVDFLQNGMGYGDEAVQALVALGFTQADAVQALNGVDSELPVEQRIKQALGQKR